MAAEISRRYLAVKRDLKALFDRKLVGRERQGNSEASWILCHHRGEEPTLYKVNAGNFIYDLTPDEIDALLADTQAILDQYLLEGGKDEIWAMEYVGQAVRDGTHQAATNLAHQSGVYGQLTTISERLNSPGIMNQIAQARVLTFTDWTGIAATAHADLANVMTDAILRGVNPRETAKVISQRLDVSESKARTIAQTEQVGALRRAQREEADWAEDELGLNMRMLWLSALKPVTRPWHAARHGKLYTTEEVEAFYAERGNKYNCYCGQTPTVVDENGNMLTPGLTEKLAKERAKWTGEGGKATEKDNPPPAVPPKPAKQRRAPKFEPKPPAPEYIPPKWEDQKSLAALERYATGRIAETVKLPKGVDLGAANTMFRSMQTMQDRFGIEKARYLGTFRGDIYSYKQGRYTLAAYAHSKRAVLLASKGLDEARYAASNAYSLRQGHINESRAFALKAKDPQLVAVINEMDELGHLAVPTPSGAIAHEYGHVVSGFNKAMLEGIANTAYEKGWYHAMSRYARTDAEELLAESFALYIERPNEARRRVYPPLYNAFKKLDRAAK